MSWQMVSEGEESRFSTIYTKNHTSEEKTCISTFMYTGALQNITMQYLHPQIMSKSFGQDSSLEVRRLERSWKIESAYYLRDLTTQRFLVFHQRSGILICRQYRPWNWWTSSSRRCVKGTPHKNAIIETFFRYAIEALPAVNGRSHI